MIRHALALAAFSILCAFFSTSAAASKFQVKELPPNAYTHPILDPRYDDERDPMEGLNRLVWQFNYSFLDQYIYRPATVVYIHTVPDPAKEGVNNFIRNLEEPSSAVNNTLQLKFDDAGNAAGRFVINSTVGLLGFIDVAHDIGMQRKQDEFGEVLAHWGVGQGPYIMLPVLGPTTIREEVGDYVDGLYPPLSWLSFWQAVLKAGVDGLYKRATLMDQEKLLYGSLDPYTFVRTAYFQHIEWKVYDGNLPETEEPEEVEDFLDEIEF